MAINIFFSTEVGPDIKNKTSLFKKVSKVVLDKKVGHNDVNIIYVGNAEIKRLNKTFLKKNRLTDVIAFNYPPSPVKNSVFGEIYICVPQAEKQAKKFKHDLLTEILTLTVHGSLHLAGWDDSTTELRDAMNRKTTLILKKLAPKNIPNW